MVSARLADRLGFDALYMTGFGVAAAALGLPDAGLATYTDMREAVARIVQGTATPVIADGDTGYGGPLNVERTVKGFEAAGAAAIQLEDQEFPKRCGHTLGRRVIAAEDMAVKIRVAVEARASRDFLVVARTDARTSLGLDEALKRADAYLRAGADALFIESPESEAEMEAIGKAFDVPLVANMVEGGRTPVLPPERLEALGFRIVIFPVTALLAAAAAMEAAYAGLARGEGAAPAPRLYGFKDFCALMGLDAVAAFDRRFGRTGE